MTSTKKNSIRVLVAMSGGVDSSVAAALLKRAGFDLSGGFMKCWDEENQFGECTSAEDAAMARRAAGAIGIPFYSFDFMDEYRERVFDYFISEYKAGRTPNPDVMCNKYIKFGLFLEKALKMGFEHIATGHYVRLAKRKAQSANGKKQFAIRYSLFAARDAQKDQSYFLWQLGQEQLRHCLFPIGGYTKPEVRAMAREFGLPNADRKDSQGICFVGKVKLDDFLREYIPEKTGDIVDTATGKVLGKHPGVSYYTLGQRRGVELAGGPYWVVEKRAQDNVLVVSRKVEDLDGKEAIVESVNWISGRQPKFPLRCSSRIRYQQPLQSCVIMRHGKPALIRVLFAKTQRAITPGQSLVFYRGKEMLGGGVIV